jgi:hypothetical protein
MTVISNNGVDAPVWFFEGNLPTPFAFVFSNDSAAKGAQSLLSLSSVNDLGLGLRSIS